MKLHVSVYQNCAANVVGFVGLNAIPRKMRQAIKNQAANLVGLNLSAFQQLRPLTIKRQRLSR
jgi:hypothetical protein